MRPDILNPLFAPVEKLPGIGPKLAVSLTKLLRGNNPDTGARVIDLLFHLPHSVIDRRNRPEIADTHQGVLATIKVRIDRHEPPPRGKGRLPYRIYVHDETGEMALTYFHGQGSWLEKQMPVGSVRYVSGKVDWFNGRAAMVHPDYVVAEEKLHELPMIEPVYPLSAGISQKIINKAVRAAVTHLPDLPEWIEANVLARQSFPTVQEALGRLHNPQDALDVSPQAVAWKRLAYDEMLAGQLALALVRSKMKRGAGKAWKGDGSKRRIILDAIPYELTGAQKRSVGEIVSDMENPQRMLRLLQGDVGSGKTIVALLACAAAIEAGGQATIMAPTEILARQHLATIGPLAEKAGIRLAILTGREKGKERERIYAELASGDIDLLVGTHAIFQANVVFKDLALGIVDEQHRFGVHQRLSLASKGGAADILVMTATPIPRTLVLTFFGDMDVSKLDEKPPTRQKVITNALSMERLDELVGRVSDAVAKGGKIYWICPLVEDNDELPVTSVETRFAALQKVLGERVGLIHGRMKPAEKDAAMDAFKNGRTQVLVATTVIEVGVDVPDATIMVIEHAERFGLAQLHQLRGRVGRGSMASTCLLLYKAPLGEVAQARIKIMRETEDGFRIAEEDLRLRGEGEILGTRQSGGPGFQIARAEEHGELLEIARDDARLILNDDPDLASPRGQALRVLLYLFSKDDAVRLLQAG
ncbi:ATP-dependent DNA helicase RecG [Pseudahrensia aquimaris]|uniref:ATP-dependent DNA helicase RecG n=1 Tax=Pseudahrensia aquimaris TaxID=744461 RepID=A0ABW3FJG3_9HYPH